jgi:hypothetical protein
MPNTPTDPDHPTKEPFSSAGESKTGGNNTLYTVLTAPFAAIGGLVDQISRKVTRAGEQDSNPTPTTDACTTTTTTE